MASFLDPFRQADGPDSVRIAAGQASRFAREVAGDFNPIHDPDSRRFCVPGDLLFALALERIGLATAMEFRFRGMAGADVPLSFRSPAAGALELVDPGGKVMLEVSHDGPVTREAAAVEAFVRRYVAFSGHNFPDYLEPLLADHGVMFNPERPLVIYERMGFRLEHLELAGLHMELAGSRLEVTGKRGEATLDFHVAAASGPAGTGSKRLVVSGLRPYDPRAMDAFVAEFRRRRDAAGGPG